MLSKKKVKKIGDAIIEIEKGSKSEDEIMRLIDGYSLTLFDMEQIDDYIQSKINNE